MNVLLQKAPKMMHDRTLTWSWSWSWSWWCGPESPSLWSWASEVGTSCRGQAESLSWCPCSCLKMKHKSDNESSSLLQTLMSDLSGGLTCAGAAVGVMAGVRGRSVAPQAGVALTVGAGVACCAAELRGAAAGADRILTWKEPASHCGGRNRP